MADQEQTTRRITSRSAKLPQHGLEAVRAQVKALADLAAPSTKERIAEQLGVAAKGRFNGKLAAARYYGLIEKADKSRYQLTDRGRAFLGADADEQLRAKREAVMGTNFGPIIYLLRSEEPKEKVIAARLQDDVGVPAKSSAALAKTLVSVSREAQLIAENGRFSSSAVEDTQSALEAAGGLPGKVTPPASGPAESSKQPVKRTPQKNGGAPDGSSGSSGSSGSKSQRSQDGGQGAPLAPAPVQVVVNVDASKLTASEIAELVRALREPPPKITS